MDALDPLQALQAAQRPVRRDETVRPACFIVGAAGALGGAVLEHALGRGAHREVFVATAEPLQAAPRGLQAVVCRGAGEVAADAPGAQAPQGLPAAPLGLVVFDQPRGRLGREAAFYQPAPQDLLAWAQALRAAGTRELVIVWPHAPALLPEALREGLWNVDEAALARLGFERLFFVRPAQWGASKAAEGSLPERLARTLLGSLRWMVADAHQPVFPRQVVDFVFEALLQWRALPEQPASRTRVASAEWIRASVRQPEARSSAFGVGRREPAVRPERAAQRRHALEQAVAQWLQQS